MPKNKPYPDRRPWSCMALLEERFHFGLRTREADVATTTLKFGEELNIASSTARERVDGYFRSLARTLLINPKSGWTTSATTLIRQSKPASRARNKLTFRPCGFVRGAKPEEERDLVAIN